MTDWKPGQKLVGPNGERGMVVPMGAERWYWPSDKSGYWTPVDEWPDPVAEARERVELVFWKRLGVNGWVAEESLMGAIRECAADLRVLLDAVPVAPDAPAPAARPVGLGGVDAAADGGRGTAMLTHLASSVMGDRERSDGGRKSEDRPRRPDHEARDTFRVHRRNPLLPGDGMVTDARATYLPWDRLVELNRFGSYVYDAWGHRPYLVGSALVRLDYRDVDVRLILPDDEFAERFGEVEKPRWKNARWNAHCIAWTHFGQSITGLVIDFQIDQQTQANAEHEGRRHPLGIGGWGPG